MTLTRRRGGSRSAATTVGDSPPDDSPVDLPHDVAVELLAAVITDFARHHGLRLLVIKGRALTEQGLRQARGSSDVDVLVDPAGFDRVWRRLRADGWWDRDKAVLVELPAAGSVLAPHARTLEHPQWPCHLDLHRYYPGLLSPAQEVFDALWEARTTVTMAHAECAVPSATDHWLIAALHAERSRDARQLAGLEERARARLDSDLADLGERADLLGATGPLSDSLSRLLGITPSLSDDERRLTELWRRRIASDSTLPEALVEQFRTAGWVSGVRIAVRQLLPSSRFAQAFHGASGRPMSLARFYLRRLAWAPRQVIKVWRAAGGRSR